MDTYCTRTLEGASPVDLVVALYDGMIRFLYCAAEAVDRGDVPGRRASVKRALDIIVHLQAQLRMDVGGEPAQTLSEFYASVFAQILQASHFASRRGFEDAINCVRNVREAWRQAALNSRERVASRAGIDLHPVPAGSFAAQAEGPAGAGWTA